MVKVTFTLDDETVARLRRSAERLQRPQSAVVRDAIADYADRVGRLSERERAHLLGVLDAFTSRPPTRPVAAVRAELSEIRASRRAAGIRRGRRAR
jgi:hypothetical protein